MKLLTLTNLANYFICVLGSPSATAIRKIDKDNNLVWMNGFSFDVSVKGLAVDQSETNVYLAQYSASMCFVRLL